MRLVNVISTDHPSAVEEWRRDKKKCLPPERVQHIMWQWWTGCQHVGMCSSVCLYEWLRDRGTEKTDLPPVVPWYICIQLCGYVSHSTSVLASYACDSVVCSSSQLIRLSAGVSWWLPSSDSSRCDNINNWHYSVILQSESQQSATSPRSDIYIRRKNINNKHSIWW